MSMIPEFFKDCVVAIGTEVEAVKGETKKVYIGTGFLVGCCINTQEKDQKKQYEIYLVTNKHVVIGKKRMLVKFNGTEASKDYIINLLDKDGNMLYSFCNDPSVDIVAVRINPYALINDSSTFAYFDLNAHALTIEKMKEQEIAEGDFVYTLGFPMNLVDQQKSVPICRMGCISYISHILKYGIKNINYFIDSQTFPGNSGGPVIIRPEISSINGTKSHNSAALIGILHSYIPYNDKCISLQTGEIVQVRQENSGLTLVHPVDLIIETIEKERIRIQNISKLQEENNKI